MLLSRFLLPGKPNDGPNRLVFPLAARLSRGVRVPLAPLILGHLYVWLDQAMDHHKKAVGRYDSVNLAPTSILMGFLYERFPKASSPKHLTYPACKDAMKKPMIIHRWDVKSLPTTSLTTVIDVEDDFVFRPYRVTPGVMTFKLFVEADETYSVPQGMSYKDFVKTRVRTAMCVRSCLLPLLLDTGETGTPYNPHRVLRQFGYDIGVPIPTPIRADESNPWASFTRRGFMPIMQSLGSIPLPAIKRVGLPTRKWLLHWAKQAKSFMDFPSGEVVEATASLLAKWDSSFWVPKEDRKTN